MLMFILHGTHRIVNSLDFLSSEQNCWLPYTERRLCRSKFSKSLVLPRSDQGSLAATTRLEYRLTCATYPCDV
jgi:hypothetical protein